MFHSIKSLIWKFTKNSFNTYILIPFFLIILWVSLSIIYNTYSGAISVLTYGNNPKTDRIDLHLKEILKDQIVYGSFYSEDNNLGILSVRFNTFNRINNDLLTFSIKEKGNDNWYYSNKYKVDQFQPDDLFTFGFPIIKNSKGKSFDFRIQSINGKHKDAVAISTIEPIFVKKYQFAKNELLRNDTLLAAFFYKKFLNAFSSFNFVVSSLIYLYPLAIYILWLYPIKPSLRYLYKRYVLMSKIMEFIIKWGLIVLIFINILFVNKLSSVWATVILIFSWVLIIQKYKYSKNVNYYLCLILLVIIPVLLILNLFVIAERAGIWTYYFFIIGFLQNFISEYFLIPRALSRNKHK